MPAHREAFDIGGVIGFVENLEQRWQIEDTQTSRRLPDDEVAIRIERDLPAPPPTVWEWLAAPALRTRWQVGTLDVTTSALRLDAGVTNHCVHGQGSTLEQILEWRPFEESTRISRADFGEMTSTGILAAIGTGTHLTILIGRMHLSPGLPEEGARGMIESLWGASLDQLTLELRAASAAATGASPASEAMSVPSDPVAEEVSTSAG